MCVGTRRLAFADNRSHGLIITCVLAKRDTVVQSRSDSDNTVSDMQLAHDLISYKFCLSLIPG
jgi:hypothetical protein